MILDGIKGNRGDLDEDWLKTCIETDGFVENNNQKTDRRYKAKAGRTKKEKTYLKEFSYNGVT